MASIRSPEFISRIIINRGFITQLNRITAWCMEPDPHRR